MKNNNEANESMTRGLLPLNLQFFAEENVETDVKDDEEDENGVGEKDDQTESGKSGKENKQKPEVKTFSQEQVNRMMTKEKNQGRNSALKELGLDPKDSKTMKMVQAFINSQKTDDQIQQEKESEVNMKLQEATERALKAECKAEAMHLGAKKEFVDDVVVLAMAKYNDDADFKTLIGELKTKYKNFFDGEEDEEDEKSTGKKGTGSVIKKDKSKTVEKEEGLGKRLAAQRVGTSKKKSNFSRQN